MNQRYRAVVLLLILFAASTTLAEAVSAKFWTDSRFLGISKTEAWKLLGKPSAPGELDGWVITDSPDFMLMGMLGYSSDKVSMVFTVCQPKITYEKLKEIQLKSEETTPLFDDARGLLCKYKQQQPGGSIFISISRTDDPNTGPMICESLVNPFESTEAGTPEPAPEVKAPGKIDVGELKSVMVKDIFDWQLLDEKGKLALLNQIMQLWRTNGEKIGKNINDAQALKDNIHLGDQANIFESACKAAGINPDPYQAMTGNEN